MGVHISKSILNRKTVIGKEDRLISLSFHLKKSRVKQFLEKPVKYICHFSYKIQKKKNEIRKQLSKVFNIWLKI